MIPYGLKEKAPIYERSVGIRCDFETHRTTTPCQSFNHSIYSVSARQLYEKLERREINSYSSFPMLESESYEVELHSVVVRLGLLCPTVAPALKPPGLVVRPQDSKAPPLCLNLHSRANQMLFLMAERDSSEGNSILYHTDVSRPGFIRE